MTIENGKHFNVSFDVFEFYSDLETIGFSWNTPFFSRIFCYFVTYIRKVLFMFSEQIP